MRSAGSSAREAGRKQKLRHCHVYAVTKGLGQAHITTWGHPVVPSLSIASASGIFISAGFMAVEGARTCWVLIAWSYLEILFAQQHCDFWDALGCVVIQCFYQTYPLGEC